MVEETSEVVYDIGYGYSSNPCRYLQDAFKGFLKCLGLYNEQKEKNDGGNDSGDDVDNGGGSGGREVDDPSIMDPTDEPISETGIVTRRAPPRRPISSGGPGQTN